MPRAGYHRWLVASMLTALAVTVGYLFAPVPNLELITAVIVAAGFLTGPGFGLLTGAAAMLIYSLFNSWGAPMPLLLLAQITGMALAGAVGGLLPPLRWLERPPMIRGALFGLIGFVLTLVYDIMTTLSFAPVLTGGDSGKILAIFINGALFYGLHLLSNTLIFALLLPLLLERLRPFIRR